LNVFAVANSKKVLLTKNGVSKNWKQDLLENGDENFTVNDIDRETNHEKKYCR
jgi:hypothetical protein